MIPTLRPGQIVFASGWYRKLLVGDIVTVFHNNREVIKRVGNVTDGKLYILGDNSESSTDSRCYGWVHESSVTGKVVLVYS